MTATATKDITDEQVVRAAAANRNHTAHSADAALMAETGAPYKVAMSAIERAARRGLVVWGVCPNQAWPTPAGDELLAGVR